jgi:small subunit ribosomal protein S3
MRPGLVIGRGGETIKELAASLEHNFKVSNPQISVSEIEVPEFNARVVANRVSSALERGVHFRRAGFWALNQVMEAGALGCEIVISGKLTTERARFEKFRAGHYPIVGEPALRAMKTAEVHVQLKPGMIGVRVKIMPPDAYFPDKVQILDAEPEQLDDVVTVAPQPAPAAPVAVEQAPSAPEPEPEPAVQATEVADESKPVAAEEASKPEAKTEEPKSEEKTEEAKQ